MYHDYDPTETPDAYLARKQRADREFAERHAKERAQRRKRVRQVRRIKAKEAAHAYRH